MSIVSLEAADEKNVSASILNFITAYGEPEMEPDFLQSVVDQTMKLNFLASGYVGPVQCGKVQAGVR